MAGLPEGVVIRPGTRADGALVTRLWIENDELVEGAPSTELVLDHLFDRASVVVADVAGTAVGFGGALRLGSIVHVTDLFVDRDHQGRGIGRMLLRAALGDAVERTTFSSADPRAVPAYVRAGMRPWWPNLYLAAGPATTGRLAGLAGGRSEVRELDARRAGAAGVAIGDDDRALDYAHWARRPGAVLFEVRLEGAAAAVGAAATRLRGEGGQLLRLVVARDADPVAAVVATLRFVGERLGPPAFTLPGPHPALGPLLEAGVRIVDRDTFMATERDLVDPERLLPHPAYL